MGGSKSKHHHQLVLSEEDLDFIARNTSATRDDVTNQYKNFISKHPSGKISKQDFKHMVDNSYPKTDTAKMQKHVFQMYDTNKDGSINFREFMLINHIMRDNGSLQEKFKQMFRAFDANGDGVVSLRELQRIVKDVFPIMSRDDSPETASQKALVQMALHEMDANKDGKVTEEEFVTACMKEEKFTSTVVRGIFDIFLVTK